MDDELIELLFVKKHKCFQFVILTFGSTIDIGVGPWVYNVNMSTIFVRHLLSILNRQKKKKIMRKFVHFKQERRIHMEKSDCYFGLGPAYLN